MAFSVVLSWGDVRKYENLTQFNTDWLASPGAWYYFSFSRSGYDLTVIKSRQTWNCYSLFWDFLLKTQIYKLLVGAVVVQCTIKTTYLKKGIYFFSIMCYSTNQLKSYMLFSSKSFVFCNFTKKKNLLLQKMVGRLALSLLLQCLLPWIEIIIEIPELQLTLKKLHLQEKAPNISPLLEDSNYRIDVSKKR